MSRIPLPSLVIAAMVTGLWSLTPIRGSAQTNGFLPSAPVSRSSPTRQLAQLFYPPVSDEPTLRVIGKGRASQPADRASLQFKFTENYSSEPPPEGILSQFETTPEPLSKESLQPIVDALKAIGIPSDAIEVRIVEPRGSILPFPFPSTATEGGALVMVAIEQPTRDRMEEIVKAAKEAANKLDEVLLNEVGVQYLVNDCQALERSAYQSAVEDAQNRASGIAAAMGAELRRVPSVAEPFYNVFLPGCSSASSSPFGSEATSPYDPNAPVEVAIAKEIFVTYTVR
ncbi:MAG TPA: hypothetical protein DDZ80_32805 [Cyanobacteria bacterium UBA8803]|nr:hypothetical protein [Cyanobacteria bacterium UBA9273]HBL62980.1 hypothetical protein [Cyanobacteria bacterium UBA8803]